MIMDMYTMTPMVEALHIVFRDLYPQAILLPQLMLHEVVTYFSVGIRI